MNWELGHRARVIQKFKNAYKSAIDFQDYELLELLLFFVNIRKDTKPIAKILIKKFGDLNGVISADDSLLLETDGVGDRTVILLHLISKILEATLRSNIKKKKVRLSSIQDIVNYCFFTMKNLKNEVLHAFYLNKKNILVYEEQVSVGDISSVYLNNRKIVHKAISVGASAIILVHNHPSGDATPTHEDVEITKRFKNTASTLDIELHDHVIIGDDGYSSMKKLGLL